MKSESVTRHRPDAKVILLSILIVTVGILFEYVDRVILNKSAGAGPDIFPPWITCWDSSLILHVNPTLITPIFTVFFSLVTHVGSTLTVLILCVLFYLSGYRREAMLIFATVVLGTLVVSPLKITLIRFRPCSTLPTVIALECEAGSSFPSGHSERIFALATILRGKGRKRAALLYILAATVAFSRVYLGVHYPLDIFVGSLIGLIVGKVTLRLEKRMVGTTYQFIKPIHG